MEYFTFQIVNNGRVNVGPYLYNDYMDAKEALLNEFNFISTCDKTSYTVKQEDTNTFTLNKLEKIIARAEIVQLYVKGE